jgi:hypothetical protein
MPEWHARDTWTRMGLWDLIEHGSTLRRDVNTPMLDALRRAQRIDDHEARQRTLRVVDAHNATDSTKHTLPRTGNTPLSFDGTLLFRGHEPADKYNLSVYRTEQGSYVAAVQIATPDALVHHVMTSAPLRQFVELLRYYDPDRILGEHGIVGDSARRTFEPGLVERWQRQVGRAIALLDREVEAS